MAGSENLSVDIGISEKQRHRYANSMSESTQELGLLDLDGVICENTMGGGAEKRLANLDG